VIHPDCALISTQPTCLLARAASCPPSQHARSSKVQHLWPFLPFVCGINFCGIHPKDVPIDLFLCWRIVSTPRTQLQRGTLHKPVIVIIDLTLFIFKFLPISWQWSKHSLNSNPKELLVLVDVHPQVLRKLVHLLKQQRECHPVLLKKPTQMHLFLLGIF
jgi:hypothetical protein